jgi:hypothetical protein
VSLPPLRAPREHGSLYVEPPLEQVGALLQRNRTLLTSPSIDLLGCALSSLRRLARTHAMSAARAYFAEADEPVPPAADSAFWILAGHQPELFHPGVWAKNFALAGLARRWDAFSLNLIVDNDTAKAPTLRLPAGNHVAQLPFDRWQGEAPYEERPVLDEALFASLPERARPLTARWPFTPLLDEFWEELLRKANHTPLLGERIAAARRVFERRWGCHQYEVPLSRLCQGEAFARFAGHMLVELPRLHEVYNEVVHEYRQRHGLRSRNHPVPDLGREGEWLESPFWAWRPGQARRGRLLVRRTATALELRAGDERWPTLPVRADALAAAWLRLEGERYKVRTRALTTTLFARLCLGDLFMHGIGGGKYDELTDALLERFFGVPAPAYMVLSATLLLPLPHVAANAEQCQQLARHSRDLWYNPQRHLAKEPAPAIADLVRQKQAWIERVCFTAAERHARFFEIRRLTELLRPSLEGETEASRRAAEDCRARLHVNEILSRRDYAFCLYPEAMLRPFYQVLSR